LGKNAGESQQPASVQALIQIGSGGSWPPNLPQKVNYDVHRRRSGFHRAADKIYFLETCGGFRQAVS
jgi:hypothetical protein